MTTPDAISFLDKTLRYKADRADKNDGLPQDVYLFVSRSTPLVCVDLWVQDKQGVLLSWRNDAIYGQGWHVPGGIVRYKETFEHRLQKTAENELGCPVTFDPKPMTIEELIVQDRENCGHIIAFLYRCFIPKDYAPDNHGKTACDAGYLQWHKTCPKNLLNVQNYYRGFFAAGDLGSLN
ncbi:hypothetical protein FACS1894190_09830 [Spirochaetia bacterium]|nr:hypothetical protein FACS1894190_09830 [Spirochaetia bacterium]